VRCDGRTGTTEGRAPREQGVAPGVPFAQDVALLPAGPAITSMDPARKLTP